MSTDLRNVPECKAQFDGGNYVCEVDDGRRGSRDVRC